LSLGARYGPDATRFRIWAPRHEHLELVLNPGLPSEGRRPLSRMPDGTFTGVFDGINPGDLYAYAPDEHASFPDPASRFQPHGVHGPSAVIDPAAYHWSDADWRGVSMRDAVIYELHVGTFSRAGTFAGVTERLPYLADLGITAIELMPIADFPGSRNWGYDGVCLFAPSRAYGTPDDLRRLVDMAHRIGLAVLLDVVYNHFGPDGAYGFVFSPFYASTRHKSPWGSAVNLDGELSEHVREFFIENALHWLHEYHFDGLRLDATHALVDDSSRHFVAELNDRVRASVQSRTVLLIAEDDRNASNIVRSRAAGGWGMDGVWADDFHHQVRRQAAGDCDGYYQDFSGTMSDLASTIRRGWFYDGQFSPYRGEARGSDPSGVPLERMVVCIQNHDQVGNRPFGRRLNHQVDPALYRALSALLALVPETPLLFMGQEWAASTRFLFFTDHHVDLGRLVTEGRLLEFARFIAFSDPETHATIPDPQALSTFESSRLVWDELARPLHAGVHALYRRLLRLRRREPALAADRFEVTAMDEASLVLVRHGAEERLLLALCTGPARRVDLERWRATAGSGRWEIVLTTDDAPFLEAPERSDLAPTVHLSKDLAVTFRRAGAVILRGA
jgi:maltooligosyltrehalose trehalohydrolase